MNWCRSTAATRLADLIPAAQSFVDVNRRRLSFEWAMIDGVNDRPSDADELAAICRRIRPAAHVNLIPLNPTPGWPTTGSSPAAGPRLPGPPGGDRGST